MVVAVAVVVSIAQVVEILVSLCGMMSNIPENIPCDSILPGHHTDWLYSLLGGGGRTRAGLGLSIIPFLTMIYLVLTLSISPEKPKVFSSTLPGHLY